ncbi:uncharacterized protein [Battus philenor]|uniref:uncharacterized protein n=1 Tax=Battus philenor TaxID=42288 RepID=UPI0035CF4B71
MYRKCFLQFSRNCANWPPTNKHLILPQKICNDFRKTLPKIYSETFAKTSYFKDSNAKERLQKVIEYFTLERIQVQGQLAIFAYQALEDPAKITEESMYQIYTIAWCVEMGLSYYLIIDDIDDKAETRNGKPCWHLLPDVGTMALNDASMMRSFISEILNHNLREDMYNKIIKLFNEAFFRSDYGQYLDSVTSKNRNFSSFNVELFTKISDSKFTYYFIKFPILVALAMANYLNKESIQNVDQALKHIGCWIQMHNDILDWCDESVTGKTNTDIKNGKASWLAANALQKCYPNQREIFLSHYGSHKPDDVQRILKLYDELGLRDEFCQDHRTRLNNILKQINSLPKYSIPNQNFFNEFLTKLYPLIVFFPEALEFDQNNRQKTLNA